MGKIAIAAFRPKPGMEHELLAVIKGRLPLLRSLGLATQRENITMRSSDGVIIDISEWVDDEAIARAHQTPEVLAMWERFGACCDFVKLNSLAESHDDFASFEAISL